MNELIIVNSGLIVLLLFFSIRQIYRDRKTQDLMKKYMKDCDQVLEEYPALLMADLQFSKRMKQMDQTLLAIEQKIQALENKRDNDGGYQHALKILEMGGTKEEIIESCHLTAAEAELLMSLHSYRVALQEE